MTEFHEDVEQSTESKHNVKDKLTPLEVPTTQTQFKTRESEFKHYRHRNGCPKID